MSNVLDFGVNGQFSSKVGGLGTVVKYFPRPLGPSIGVAPSTPSANSAVGALLLPAGNVYNGQQFSVLASGYLGSDSGDPSGTVTVQLYAVTGSVAAPVYTSIATTGAITPFYTVEPWSILAELVGASVVPTVSPAPVPANGMLIGNYQSSIRASVIAPTIVTSVITNLDFNAGNVLLAQGAVLGFVVGVTFGTSDATNKAALTEFTIES
jgi:hypothetical protein